MRESARNQSKGIGIILLCLLAVAQVHGRELLSPASVFIAKEAIDAAHSRSSAQLVGRLFSVLTTFSTLGGLAQGGLAFAAKDVREAAMQMLVSTKGLQGSIDKLLLPPATKLAMKASAQSLESAAGRLLSLGKGRFDADLTNAIVDLLVGLERDITELADLSPSLAKAFSPLMGDGRLLQGPLVALNMAAKAVLAGEALPAGVKGASKGVATAVAAATGARAASKGVKLAAAAVARPRVVPKGVKLAAAAGAGVAASKGVKLLGATEAGLVVHKLLPMHGELKALDVFLGASNTEAVKAIGEALKAFGVSDSELLDMDSLRKEVRAAINNIDELAPLLAGVPPLGLNITTPVSQAVTGAVKAAAGSG